MKLKIVIFLGANHGQFCPNSWRPPTCSSTFTYNSLNLSRKGSKLLSCKFVFCLFIESLSMRYVIRSIHHSTVCYFIALMSSLSCSQRVRSWFVLLRVPTVSHLRVKPKVKCLPDLPSRIKKGVFIHLKDYDSFYNKFNLLAERVEASVMQIR